MFLSAPVPNRGSFSVHSSHLNHFCTDFYRGTSRRPCICQHILQHEPWRPIISQAIRYEYRRIKRQHWNHFRWSSRDSHTQLDLSNAWHGKHLKPQMQINLLFYENCSFFLYDRFFSVKLHPVNLLSASSEFKNQMDNRWKCAKNHGKVRYLHHLRLLCRDVFFSAKNF